MRTILPLVLLHGCDLGSLLSAGELERLYAKPPLPADPAWQIRWIGPDGMVVGCELLDAEVFDPQDSWDSVFAVEPSPPEPEVWNINEEEGVRWAVGLVTLVNAEQITAFREDAPEEEEDVEEDEEAADFEGQAASLELDDGVWGVVPERVLLYGQGNMEALAREFSLPVDLVEELDEIDGFWLGMLPQFVELRGEVQGALYPLSEDEGIQLEEYGLEVTTSYALADVEWEVFSGFPFEGIVDGCAR
ncbi:MAG: hypothetical protein AAFV53_25945 [Myxococcota bacterium]